jgi:hypothetical protein
MYLSATGRDRRFICHEFVIRRHVMAKTEASRAGRRLLLYTIDEAKVENHSGQERKIEISRRRKSTVADAAGGAFHRAKVPISNRPPYL